jgi:peptidyl-tRNA hydrolase, PTH2 family
MSEEWRDVKQVIVIRRDLKMRRGKEIAQGAHASMAWLSNRLQFGTFGVPGLAGAAFTSAERLWLTGSFRKITCQVQNEDELTALAERARELGITAHVITDSGLTEFSGTPTITALAVGPDFDDLVDQVTGHLEPY